MHTSGLVRGTLGSILLLAASLVGNGALAAAAGQAAGLAAQVQPTNWEVLTGADYFVGKYKQASDTTVAMLPLNARIQMDRVRLELSLNYLWVKGPGLVAGGGIVVPGSSKITKRSGLGDTNVGAAWLIYRGDLSTPSVELSGTVKIPTADAGLGTQKTDYTVIANLYQALSPQWMLLGSAGYQWLGDFGTVQLKEGTILTAGMNYKPTTESSIGAVIAYRQEYFSGLGDAVSLSPYFATNFDGMWRFSAYGLVGLTDASPSWGGGLRIGLYH
jgi:hypothetical protein